MKTQCPSIQINPSSIIETSSHTFLSCLKGCSGGKSTILKFLFIAFIVYHIIYHIYIYINKRKMNGPTVGR